MELETKDMGHYTTMAKVFKALCDENRLMILDLLKDGKKCACILLDELHIVQSTLSHHMKILVDSGLVLSSKDGKMTNYELSKHGFEIAKQLLNNFTNHLDSSKESCSCK